MRILLSSLILLITVSFGGVTDKHSNSEVSPKASRESIVVDDTKVFNQVRAGQRDRFRQYQAAVALWNQKIEENRVAAEKTRIAAQNAAARQRQETQAPRATGGYAAYIAAHFAEVEACIIQRESGGNPMIRNGGRDNAAAGLYQFMPGTWNWYQGYQYAWQAPPDIQREKYLQVMNNGLGWSNWHYPPRSCWPL
jgi:hypothetical protein